VNFRLRVTGVAVALFVSLSAAADSGSDRDVASRLISELGKQPAQAKLAHEPLDKAAKALQRAEDARAAGDQLHGAELEGLGREWAETASDLVRAASVEQKLAGVQKELTETETRLVRARALIEETVARRGRAKEKLEQLEKSKK
jgi:colicin import membrane protein